MVQGAKSRVVIAGTAEPLSVGGLAAYQDMLEKAMAVEFGRDRFLSLWRTDTGSTLIAEEQYAFSLRSEQKKLLRFTTRPIFHAHVEKWIRYQTRACFSAVYKFRPSVIHFIGTGYDLMGFPLWRIANSLRAKFTVWPAVHPASWGDDVIDLRLYKKAHSVFCQSDHEALHLKSLGVPVDRTVRCGLPPMCRTDGCGERLRQRFDLGSRPIVFFLGRLDKGKGYHALLDAWQRIRVVIPTAVLLIAGPGPQRPLQAGVVDLGVVDEQTKADAYAACNVFCLPSAHESFGIVYVEAWSYGKPVICGEAAAVRELVADGVNGLHSTQEVTKLAADIERLLMDPMQAKLLGSNGLKTQVAKYTVEQMLQVHLRAWEKSR